MGDLVDLAAVRAGRVGVREPRLRKGEVAAALGVSERTVENWMRRGLPFEKPLPNGSVRFVWSEVELWMGQRAGSA